MKNRIALMICLTLAAAALDAPAGQRTPRDILRGGRADAAGQGFLDAELVRKGDDGLLQLLALRRGELRQGIRGTELVGARLGLWHAYQAGDKSWVSNGLVFDLSFAAPAGAGNPRLAAASDASGRLHVVIAGAGGGLLYLLRDNGSTWRSMAAESLPDGLSEMSLVPSPEAGGGLLIGLAGDGRVVEYALSTQARDASGGFRWTRTVYPAGLEANSFAVSRDDRKLYYLFQTPGGEFRGAERHIASGKWIPEQPKFMRDFQAPTGGAALRSMAGFMDANNLPQVVGLVGDGGVVHIYRDEINTWYNNGVALKVEGLRRVTGCVDAGGLINVVGLTAGGRLWHGFRSADQRWHDNGMIGF